MPLSCTFVLNSKGMSTLDCGEDGKFDAFSGLYPRINDPAATALDSVGPLPKGKYYIVDRKSGGRLGPLRDWIDKELSTDRNDWFSLYRDDDDGIDDSTVEQGVTRGGFRLHPKGPLGISEGCITLPNKTDFDRLHDLLKHSQTMPVPGTPLPAYGIIEVK